MPQNFRDVIDEEIAKNVIELRKFTDKQFVQQSMGETEKFYASFKKSVIKKRIKHLMLLKAYYEI